MGCASSSPSFRETYANLKKRWHLNSETYFSVEEASVNERSRLFESYATERARSVSRKLLYRGKCTFTCSPLVVEQFCLLTPPFAEEGKAAALHPYTVVLYQRLLGAVSAEHAYHTQQKEVESSRVTHFLARWDYRIWMITCCEFFNVLAVLQASNGLPKEVRGFMKSLPDSLTAKSEEATLAPDDEADVKSKGELLAQAWKEGSATLLTAKMLTPRVMKALRAQFPAAFAGTAALKNEDSLLVAQRLINLTREYEMRLAKVMNLRCSNPLYAPSGTEESKNPSFLTFVEWVALQCALSVCGLEEEPASYGVVHIECSEKVLRRQNDAMETWRKRLYRLEAVEEQLAELEPLGDRSQSYLGLQAEKKVLEAETEELFAQWCGRHSCLTAEEVTERCFEVLGIQETLPDSSVHEVLSAKAFENATRGSDSGTIDTPGGFRQYLKAYLALHDLYRDVLLHQLNASLKGDTYDMSWMPGSVNFESFQAGLWNSQMRHDVELDPLVAAVGGGKGILTAEEVVEVFQQLFNMEGTEDSSGDGTRVFNFDAVCTTVAEDLVPAGETLPLRLSIEQLGHAVGLTKPKDQARFIASFLNQVFTLSENRLSNCSTALAAEALEAVLELPCYTDYSAGIGVMAVRFAYLSPPQWSAFALKEPPSSNAFVKWLYTIRSESADRLALDEHINSSFFVRALFAIAAAQRAFEDTVPDKAGGGRPLSASGAGPGQSKAEAQKEHQTTESHFVRAVASMCKYLDCSAETLLRNCSSLLGQNEEDGTRMSAPAESAFTVESAFASFHNAFRLLRGATEAGAEGGVGDATESMVSIQHVLFVVVSNYTRLHCSAQWRSNNVYDFYDSTFSGLNSQPVPQWKDEKDVLALRNAMPLHGINGTYREFAKITNSCTDADGDGNGDKASAFQQSFLHAFYELYRPFFAKLELNESAVVEMGRRAFRYITSNPNRGGNAASLTHNDYSGFLQFVLAHVMMQKAYECTLRDSAVQAGAGRGADGEETFLSESDLRRMLACFTRLTDGGASNIPKVDEAHAWLQSRGIDNGYEGFLSLDNAFLWYGAHRIESYALESLFSWWKEKMAPRIPFTVSTADRFKRLSATREILRIKQHRENLPEEEPVELAEDEDGYLPVNIMAYVMKRRGRLDEITLRVFHMFEQENALDGAEPQSVDEAFEAAAWLKSCVRGLNAVVHRSDLESREVHHSDFRFLLQYIHHFISAYVGLYYTLTVLEVSSQSGPSGGDLDQITGVSDEDRARLVDTFRQSVVPLLLPSGTAPADMTSVLDTLLSKAWEDKRTKSVVTDSTCQEVAHGIAALFVHHSHEISARARHSYLDNRESQALQEAFTTERAFHGALGVYIASTKLKYWERLRLLLPFGPSRRHRERRRELYAWMDKRQRGYLTISDLAAGLMDLVQLQSFCVDFTPALLRAFMATKEMSGEHESVVYLTQKSEEQVLLPAELDAFLTYLYRYLELYFMFDVLTCGGHVHPETLHVVQKKQSYGSNDEDEEEPTSGLRANPSATVTPSAVSETETSTTTKASAACAVPRSGAVALLEAAKKPYQITLEAAPMRKEITLAQFRMGRQLLRKWGAHVKNPDEVFYTINNRRREADAMTFIGFAIWASQHDLHPEGYGYGYDDSVDAIATMEEEYASL